MDMVMCPLGCARAREIIHVLCPDSALLNVLMHGMQVHPEIDPLDYLDGIRQTALELNGV
jgi:hypothetical protein